MSTDREQVTPAAPIRFMTLGELRREGASGTRRPPERRAPRLVLRTVRA